MFTADTTSIDIRIVDRENSTRVQDGGDDCADVGLEHGGDEVRISNETLAVYLQALGWKVEAPK